MTTLLNFGRDIAGFNAFAPIPSTNLFSAILAADTDASFIVPSDYKVWIVAFSYAPGASVWVSFDGTTATLPVGGTFADTNASLNPAARTVYAGDEISLITSDMTAYVGIELYATSYT